jgi:hypothetical protein
MMRSFVLALSLISGVALANPGVTQNTDVGKRKSKRHYQVTRCENDKCEVYEVTEFNKPLKTQGTYSEQCFFIVEDKKRFMACNKMPEPQVIVVPSEPVVKTVVKTKTVERKVYVDRVERIENKKNRFSLHIGYGPNGLTKDETNDDTKVTEYRSPIVGASYSRLVSDKVSFGLTGFSNSTIALSVGLDF